MVQWRGESASLGGCLEERRCRREAAKGLTANWSFGPQHAKASVCSLSPNLTFDPLPFFPSSRHSSLQSLIFHRHSTFATPTPTLPYTLSHRQPAPRPDTAPPPNVSDLDPPSATRDSSQPYCTQQLRNAFSRDSALHNRQRGRPSFN